MRLIKVAASLQRLFDDYQQAFLSLSADAICNCYQLPCVITDADGRNEFIEYEALLTKFHQNCGKLAQMELQSVSFRFVSIAPINEQQFQVKLVWQLVLADKQLDVMFDYLCLQDDQEWRINTASVCG